MDDFEALRNLLSGYLGEDWPAEFGSWEASVDTFVADDPDSAAHALVAADALAARPDSAISAYLHEIWCGYDPAGAGDTSQEWLSRVAARLRARLSMATGT